MPHQTQNEVWIIDKRCQQLCRAKTLIETSQNIEIFRVKNPEASYCPQTEHNDTIEISPNNYTNFNNPQTFSRTYFNLRIL